MSRNFTLAIVAITAFSCAPMCYGAGSKAVRARIVDRTILWDAFLRTWEGQSVPAPQELVPFLLNKEVKVKVTHEFLCRIFPDDSITKVPISNNYARTLMHCHYNAQDYFMKLGIELQNKKVDAKTGIMVTDMKYKNIIYPNRSFFPSRWDKHRTMAKIVEAFNRLIKPLEPPIVGAKLTDHIVIFGKTRENIVIKMVIDPSGEFITAFPDAKMNGLA